MTTKAASRVTELARHMLRLRTRGDQLKRDLEDVQAEKELISQELVGLMENLEAQSLKLDGATIYLQTKHYVRAVPERAEELVAWLDEHDLGVLAKRSVHAQTLQAEYNRWMAEDKPIPPVELVTAFPKTEVRVRKAEKKEG